MSSEPGASDRYDSAEVVGMMMELPSFFWRAYVDYSMEVARTYCEIACSQPARDWAHIYRTMAEIGSENVLAAYRNVFKPPSKKAPA